MQQAGKWKGITLGLTVGLLCANAVFAQDATQEANPEDPGKPFGFDLSIGTELMSGDTTYTIGGATVLADGTPGQLDFPISKLEWPLDIWLARIDGGIDIGSSWRINGTLKKNMSDPDDHMKDSDPPTSTSSLNIYSESNISDFDALIWDIDIDWIFLRRPTWNLYAGLGYEYQNFDYEGRLIQQSSNNPGEPAHVIYGDGSLAITYDITYQMPYLLFGGEFQILPNLTLMGSIAYSPWVNAEDEDHHLLRDKTSIGDMDGTAIIVDVSGRYTFLSSWFMEAGILYTKIDVDGTQNQSFDGVHYGSIYQESESTQTSGFLKIGYTF